MEETLASLDNAIVNDNVLGGIALAFAKELVNGDTTQPDETHTVRYSLTASGHTGEVAGSASYTSISFQANFVPVPEASSPTPAPEPPQQAA
jgi:hypothetical protein